MNQRVHGDGDEVASVPQVCHHGRKILQPEVDDVDDTWMAAISTRCSGLPLLSPYHQTAQRPPLRRSFPERQVQSIHVRLDLALFRPWFLHAAFTLHGVINWLDLKHARRRWLPLSCTRKTQMRCNLCIPGEENIPPRETTKGLFTNHWQIYNRCSFWQTRWMHSIEVALSFITLQIPLRELSARNPCLLVLTELHSVLIHLKKLLPLFFLSYSFLVMHGIGSLDG